MPRPKKKIHYIYKTTCLITGRYYIGMHSTSNIDDGYLGSGTRLRRSIRKYGKENHVRAILEYCKDRESLASRERVIVTPDLILDNLCMNLKPGGSGGFNNPEHKKKFHSAGGKASRLIQAKRHHERLKMDKNYYEYWHSHLVSQTHWIGKLHTTEAKKKMSLSKKGRYTGSENSQFGTCWITKDNINRKIKCEELPKYLELGWLKGRIMK